MAIDMNKFPKTGQRLTISTHEDDIHNQENQALLLVDNPEDTEEYRAWVEQELANDELGLTSPNLHRRIRTNELHDGKKVYTIIEQYTTGTRGTDATYETKYPISEIKYVYISGTDVRLVYNGRKYFWKTSVSYTVGGNSFLFLRSYEPHSGMPMSVIYETTPLLDDELFYREYEVAISGVDSYRSTKMVIHTEEDEGDRDHRRYENEIP